MTRSTNAAPQKNPETGRWDFIVDIGGGHDKRGQWRKRRQVRRRGFSTKREAQAALDDLRGSARAGTYVAPNETTVAEWTVRWLEAIKARVKPSTAAAYAKWNRLHIVPRIGSMQLRQVDVATLERLYADLQRDGRCDGTGGLSVTSVRHVATTIGAALDDAVRNGIMIANPARTARHPTASGEERPEMQTWSAGELATFLANEEPTPYGPAFKFLALTGCRRGETLGVQWDDLDLDAGQASLRRQITAVEHEIHRSATTKTGRGRSIRLQPGLVAALRTQSARQAEHRLMYGPGYATEGLVFAQPDGRPFHPDHFSREFDRRVKRHGLRKIRLHDLRHTYATLALEAGVPAKVVADRLGHSSVMVTLDLYSHVMPAVEADHADTVADIIANAGGNPQ